MLFNSLEFIYVYLPAVVGLYYLLCHLRLISLCSVFLFLASLLFYAYWNFLYIFVIATSLIFNFIFGHLIQKYSHRWLMLIGVTANLLLLGYFKYFNFFLDNIAPFFPRLDFRIHVLLPLGISFFTFQQIAYLVDVYQKKTQAYRFLEYGLFVTFFPQLIAGPIVHYSEMMPQFRSLKSKVINYKNIYIGIYFFLVGLFQKVVIADFLAPIADKGFANAHLLNFFEAWSAVIAYTLQIYYDFSGYSNMAIGLGLFFNIRIPVNFFSPYKAVSIIDFWRRWHMTLSRFLRDYLYIPLGGNRKGAARRYLNVFITMLLGGLWHGAAWTFVAWGAFHGVLICINQLWNNLKIELHGLVARGLTFIVVVFGWVLFRAETMGQGIEIFKSMLGLKGIVLSNLYFIEKEIFMGLLFLLFLTFALPNSHQIERQLKPLAPWVIGLIVCYTAVVFCINRASVFLYWQF